MEVRKLLTEFSFQAVIVESCDAESQGILGGLDVESLNEAF